MRAAVAAVLGLAAGAGGTYALLAHAPPVHSVVAEVPGVGTEVPAASLKTAEELVTVPSRPPVEPSAP